MHRVFARVWISLKSVKIYPWSGPSKMLMPMLKKHHHLHECLYGVSIHIDLAIYESSSKIGECIEFWHTLKSLYRIGLHGRNESHRCLGPWHNWCRDNKMFVSYGENLRDWFCPCPCPCPCLCLCLCLGETLFFAVCLQLWVCQARDWLVPWIFFA